MWVTLLLLYWKHFSKSYLGVFSATIQSQHKQRTHVTQTITWTLTKTITWLWRWLLHRLSKRKSQTTVLLRTPITQIIFFNQGMLLLGSNHFLKHVHYKSWLSSLLSSAHLHLAFETGILTKLVTGTTWKKLLFNFIVPADFCSTAIDIYFVRFCFFDWFRPIRPG